MWVTSMTCRRVLMVKVPPFFIVTVSCKCEMMCNDKLPLCYVK